MELGSGKFKEWGIIRIKKRKKTLNNKSDDSDSVREDMANRTREERLNVQTKV